MNGVFLLRVVHRAGLFSLEWRVPCVGKRPAKALKSWEDMVAVIHGNPAALEGKSHRLGSQKPNLGLKGPVRKQSTGGEGKGKRGE